MNLKYVPLVFLTILFSCEKENIEDDIAKRSYSSEIRFAISEHIAEGEAVKNIEFTENGYYYSKGSEIYFNGKNGENHNYMVQSEVLSMAWNKKDNSLYFGTNSSGMGRMHNKNVEYFTVENSDLPRDVILQVECDVNGNIWLNASASKIGGLVKYDGRRFTTYLPESSNLPENLIHKIKHHNGNLFVVSSNPNKGGTITLKINGNRWTELFESGGCSMSDLDVDSNGKLYYIDDSREYCGGGLLPDEVVFSFINNKKTILREYELGEYEVSRDFPYLLEVDKRDYVWVGKFVSDQYEHLSVFDGESWNEAPLEFPDDFIHCIEVDEENNIWLGTNNGIYVLNQ